MQSTISKSLKNYIEATESIKFESSQDEVINVLLKKGFKFNKRGNDGTCYLSKKKGPMHRMAEIDTDGTVNGMSVQEFLSESVKCEEEPTDLGGGKQEIRNLIDTIVENLTGDMRDWLKEFGKKVLDLENKNEELMYFKDLFALIEQLEKPKFPKGKHIIKKEDQDDITKDFELSKSSKAKYKNYTILKYMESDEGNRKIWYEIKTPQGETIPLSNMFKYSPYVHLKLDKIKKWIDDGCNSKEYLK